MRTLKEKKISSLPSPSAGGSPATPEAGNNAPDEHPVPNPPDHQPAAASLAADIGRSLFGGTLMGLANLVPGISGGTMLLAAGIYPRFIGAIAEVTTLRFRPRPLVVLACVGIAAVLAIGLFAGLLKDLVVDQRWIMYSLFIGLTLGGLPLVYRLARPLRPASIVAGVIATAFMAGFAALQIAGYTGNSGTNVFSLFFAGIAGASAMVLPGLSGGYILLLLGQYVPILAGVDSCKEALSNRDWQTLLSVVCRVVIPVGLGVVAGVVAISNLLKFMLAKYRNATLGFLMGLLLGSIFGLWPFQQGVPPEVGQVVKGQQVTLENLNSFEADDWPVEYFTPGVFQVGCSLGLIILGCLITVGVGRLGRGGDSTDPTDAG